MTTEVTFAAVKEYAEFVGIDAVELARSIGVKVEGPPPTITFDVRTTPQTFIAKTLAFEIERIGKPVTVEETPTLEGIRYVFRAVTTQQWAMHRSFTYLQINQASCLSFIAETLVEDLRSFVSDVWPN